MWLCAIGPNKHTTSIRDNLALEEVLFDIYESLGVLFKEDHT